MSSDFAISIQTVSKKFHIYQNSKDRLLSMLPWNKNKIFGNEFWALQDINLQIRQGEVIGIIGRNGAGKSTLLQLICKTLSPSLGTLEIKGKIAALLELGSGFNPEFSGRENVYLAAAIAGMSKNEIASKYEEIVAFSEIKAFIDQPVKTYSSGMLMRLAFSVATSVDPEILIIDEALSVGDGAFARKSFDRIMHLKEKGCTILFCSHSLFQVESLCERVIWLESGKVKMIGQPSEIIPHYEMSLEPEFYHNEPLNLARGQKGFRLRNIIAQSDFPLHSMIDALSIKIDFTCNIHEPIPTLIYEIFTQNGQTVTSGITKNDGFLLSCDSKGNGSVNLHFPKINLMRGRYRIDIYLMCENVLHLYDHASSCVMFNVLQEKHEKGVVFLTHEWKQL